MVKRMIVAVLFGLLFLVRGFVIEASAGSHISQKEMGVLKGDGCNELCNDWSSAGCEAVICWNYEGGSFSRPQGSYDTCGFSVPPFNCPECDVICAIGYNYDESNCPPGTGRQVPFYAWGCGCIEI